AAGSSHPDNAAPALLGGIVLARRGVRRPVVRLPVPPGLSVALLHPRLEMSTREARSALGTTILLDDAIAQWGNTAALVAALYEGDLELLSDALEDRVAEPVRRGRVPAFGPVKEAALLAGALGCSLSGAGPSIVALCRDPDEARSVGESMLERFTAEAHVPADLHLSPVSREGARVLAPVDSPERG
ncbi:MAG: homoserine kinase, partial [Gemmatimonadetes bacterium]|nr:homoserine kinase [Gemmatimonadota bacterium]NIR81420.1 homoserine kinase [Gemmatimonadota bacterium]NIT90259.1 homoserine kinase [Gemmatimonadota bacterium]NIU34083.1 homoserine kinase [Gemmatimonadota bacterium]NIU38240.1 homoserine kinase [Gemmatimonadota bacterium]